MEIESQFDQTNLRRKAEELLKKKSLRLSLKRSEADTITLIQELEVHQIELEIQNEELILSRAQAINSSENYIELYDNAPSGYFTLSPEGQILKLNLSGAKMLGKVRSKLIGFLFVLYVTDQMKPLFRLFMTNVFSSKLKESCEITLFSKGNLPIHVHLDGVATEDGKQCLVTMIDRTALKLAEEELKLSREKLSFLVNEMQVGVLLQGPNAEIIMSNQKALELLGLDQDQLLGLSSFSPEWNVIHEDGSPFPGMTHPVPQAINTKNPAIDVVMGVYRPKTRDRVWLLVSAVPQLNLNFTVKQVVCTFIDISKRKRAELELLEAKEKADENEFFLKESQAVGKIGSYKANFISGYWKSSEALDSIFGIDMRYERSIGGWLDLIHPEDRNDLNNYLNNEVIGKRMPFNKEYRIVRINDKLTRWVQGFGSTSFDSFGNITEMIGTIQDITDRKFVEMELHLAKEKAEESDRLKSAFLANMSHEIRTPMNGILGFADLLKEEKLSGEEQKEYIGMIERSGHRMLNIINDIVDISKIDSGQMKVNITESNINEQIEYIYTFFKPEVERKGMQLYFKNPLRSKESIIQTDREKVFAILTNLVKNAIKFSDKGAIEFGYELGRDKACLVSTACLVSAPMVLQFFVKDQGIGIPKSKQEAIFERFIQADSGDKRAFQGAGLGLAISRTYVEMLGGRIWEESEEGIGSIFYFTLPYNPKLEEESGAKDTPIYDKVSLKKKLKILIAEDDDISEMLISISVKEIGKEILKVTTGVQAVETCRNNPDIDIILMDIQMPEMDGYEATREIRKFNPGVVIIAQTAFALIGERERALAAGCTDYIAKPMNPAKLVGLINRHFGIR